MFQSAISARAVSRREKDNGDLPIQSIFTPLPPCVGGDAPVNGGEPILLPPMAATAPPRQTGVYGGVGIAQYFAKAYCPMQIYQKSTPIRTRRVC